MFTVSNTVNEIHSHFLPSTIDLTLFLLSFQFRFVAKSIVSCNNPGGTYNMLVLAKTLRDHPYLSLAAKSTAIFASLQFNFFRFATYIRKFHREVYVNAVNFPDELFTACIMQISFPAMPGGSGFASRHCLQMLF